MADSLFQAYKDAKSSGDLKTAFQAYTQYISLRDSLNDEANRHANLKKQLSYEYAKKASIDSLVHAKESEIKNVELEKQKTQLKVKRNMQYALYSGLLLVMLFAAYMYNRFKISHHQKRIIEEKEKETQKQNAIILSQKNSVEHKQTEILSSILYAQKIQKALMTSESYFDKKLKELKKN
jgi:hypothetical protein